jgi:hypothetical protein
MQNLQVVCHNHQRMKQKFIFLNGQTGDISHELTLWQIVKIECKVIKVELKTCHKVKVLAYLWYDLIILILQNKNNAGDHGLMHRHYCQLKAHGIDLFAQPYRDAHLLSLAIDHMKHSLEDEDVLFLHLFYLELKLGGQFCAIF